MKRIFKTKAFTFLYAIIVLGFVQAKDGDEFISVYHSEESEVIEGRVGGDRAETNRTYSAQQIQITQKSQTKFVKVGIRGIVFW